MNKYVIAAITACLALGGCDLFVSPQERVERAAETIEKGDYETAAIELRTALQKDPDNARGRLLFARTIFWLGDVQAAEKELKRAIEAGASDKDTARLNAEIKKSLDQLQALETFTSQPRPGLKEYERQMFLGYAQLGLGKPEAAKTSFEAAVKQATAGRPSAEARTAMASGFAVGGDVRGALDVLDRALKDDSKFHQAAITKASLLMQRGDFAAAEAVLVALDAGKKKSPISIAERLSALSFLTEARLGQRKLEEARSSIEELAALTPNAPAVAFLNGRLALAEGNGAEAVTELQKAVQAAPTFLPAHLMLGLAYLNQGSNAQAEAEFQQVIEAAPENVEARKFLAQAQIRQGLAVSASAVLEPLLATGVHDAQLYTLAGQAKLMQGEREIGDALLERGLAETPDNPQFRLEMAGTYLAAGDPTRALELVATVPDDVGGDTKKQIQFLALAAGKDKAVAKLEVEALIKRYPKDVRLLNLAAGWLAFQGHIDGARAYLARALAADHRDPRTLVNVGRLELRAKREAEARKAFEAAVAADSKNGDAYLALALLEESAGDSARSSHWLQEWSRVDPMAPQPKMLLARRAFMDKKPEDGRKLLDEALKLSPNKAAIEAAAGQALMDAGLYDEALGHFRKAASLDARNPQYPFGAARAQLALDQREAARESLNRALSVRPSWLPALVLLAQIELRDKRVDAALALAGQAKKEPSTAAVGYLLEGDVRIASGQPALAAKAYSESARLSPSIQAAVGEARARRAAGLAQPDEPLIAWLARNPGDASARFALAQSYEADGRSDAAIREYEAVLVVQPDAAVVLNNLAWQYSLRNDPRAEAMARRAYQQAPMSAAIADTLGWILVQSGKLDEGLKLIQQAHDLDSKSPEIEYHLGVALMKAGRKQEARQALEAAIGNGQGAPWVTQARQVLAEEE